MFLEYGFHYFCKMKNEAYSVTAVEYLNTVAFVQGLKKLNRSRSITLSLDNPAICASKLMNGSAQIGLVPVAALPLLKPHAVFSKYCIGADGPVRTVRVLSDQPIDSLKRIILDPHSRTSVALLRILLRSRSLDTIELIDGKPGFEMQAIDPMSGILVIGDKVFGVEHRFKHSLDLAEEWVKRFDLPFVFATWVSMVKTPPIWDKVFEAALGSGLEQIPELIETYQRQPAFIEVNVREYLEQNISYAFDPEKKKGLAHFLQLLGQGTYRIPYNQL